MLHPVRLLKIDAVKEPRHPLDKQEGRIDESCDALPSSIGPFRIIQNVAHTLLAQIFDALLYESENVVTRDNFARQGNRDNGPQEHIVLRGHDMLQTSLIVTESLDNHTDAMILQCF